MSTLLKCKLNKVLKISGCLLLVVIWFSSSVETQGQESKYSSPPNPLRDQQDLNQSQPTLIDQRKVAANGIRKFSGKYVDVYTDVRDRADVDELDRVFDQAVSFWCEYFQIDESQVAGWKLSAVVMLDRKRFEQAGLYPANLPPFPAGYQQGDMFWLYVQDGNYYTRHLFLHEGTHAFMSKFLGGVGAPWYAEGMAELLSVHRWDGESLRMNFRDNRREDVPYWGRVKLIRQAVADEKLLTLDEVMAAENSSFQQVNWYAWAWAACRFFDSHPNYQNRFRELRQNARDRSPQFSARFWQSLGDARDRLEQDWNLFLREIEYGVDLEAMLVSEAEKSGDNRFDVDASRGWQSTVLILEKGQGVKISANGRFVVRKVGQGIDAESWKSEANGVTIEYFDGRPLGQLVAAIVDDSDLAEGKFAGFGIGKNREFNAEHSGRLYLRINESPAGLDDNSGRLRVSIDVK